MPLEGLTSVTAAQFAVNMRYNSGATFYIRALAESEWTTATTGLTDGTKTLASTNGDTTLSVPDGSVLTSLKKSSTAAADYTFTDEALVSYISSAALEGDYVYFAVHFHTNSAKSNDGCNFTPSSIELNLTGTKPIEGMSASLIGTKTATLYFDGTDDIAYLKKGVTGNQYSSSATQYEMTTWADTDTDNVLYLRQDLSSYLDKEITKLEFAVVNRVNRSNNKISVGRTAADWTTAEISYDNQPAADSSVSALTWSGVKNDNIERTIDITSLAANLSTSHNGVLSLKFSCTSIDGNYGARFENVGVTSGEAARLIITYKDAIGADEEITDEFTYKVTIGTSGATAHLLVGIYDSNKTLLDVIASGALTSNGTDALTMDVDLTSYATAAYVKAYLWDGVTLSPYFTPIERAATVTAAQ